MKQICQYLQGTKEQGLVFAPQLNNEEIGLDAYVDADFAGLFHVEKPQDPVSS